MFDPFDGVTRHLVHVNQFLRFFLRQILQGIGNLHDPVFLLPGHQPAQHVAQVVFEVFHASDVGDNPDRQTAFLDFDFHRPVVEPAFPQLLAELLSRVVARRRLPRLILLSPPGRTRRKQQIEHSILGHVFGLPFDSLQRRTLHQVDRLFGEVADDRFHVAPDVPDFGEFRRLDFNERGVGQFRQSPGDFRFAHARGPDHDDILRENFIAQFRAELLATPSIPQRDGHHPFGVTLSDHVPVQHFDDFPRRQAVEFLRFGR